MINLLQNWFYKNVVYTPNKSTINLTGIIKSDHPQINNGWIKGWLVDNGKNDTIIVCAHSNPSISFPNNRVFAKNENGLKYYRHIIEINKLKLKNYDLDIAICKLDAPFPEMICAYKFAENPNNNQIVFTPNQHNTILKASIILNSKTCQISGDREQQNLLVFGDSGLPWFVWENDEWRVATHTHRGLWGIGPWYSHKELYPILTKVLNLPQEKNEKKSKSFIELIFEYIRKKG